MKKVFIIAEAGVNHNGKIDNAFELINIAVDCGADAVKFQTFKTENVISRFAPKAEYQIKNTNNQESQYEMVKKLELSFDDFFKLKEYCDKKNIMFLSTPFDFESINFLNKLNLPFFKIPSGEITNLPYLRKIGSLKKKVILSTGMSYLGEIDNAIKILTDSGTEKDNISILHCNTEYPTPFESANLLAIKTLKDTYNLKIGYSDHTLGIEAVMAAVALGAEIIEKHFTIDTNMDGPDHKASIEPDELKIMIKSVRNIEKAMGNGIKAPSESEIKNINIARKSIVAKRKINIGEHFSEENITCKRPGNGISPMLWDLVTEKTAKKDFEEDELIEL